VRHNTLADCQTILGLALQRFTFTQSESGLSISFFNKSIPQDLADTCFTSVGLWIYKILLDKGVRTGTDIVRGFLHLVYRIFQPPPHLLPKVGKRILYHLVGFSDISPTYLCGQFQYGSCHLLARTIASKTNMQVL
jgi:hypothetical protein